MTVDARLERVEEETLLDEVIRLMEKRYIKRLPIARGKALFGIVAPSNFLQAVGSLAHEITADLITSATT